MGHCCADSVCAGTFYRDWNYKRLLFRAGNRVDKSNYWLLYGAKQRLACADGVEDWTFINIYYLW